MATNQKIDHHIVTLTDAHVEHVRDRLVERLQFRVVTEDNAWLRSAYELLAAHFDGTALDPYDRYVDWLERNRLGLHQFPFLMTVAYVTEGDRQHVVGVLSSHVMRVTGDEVNRGTPAGAFVHAVGRQVTSSLLRDRGIKGVGRRLWQAASVEAHNSAARLGGVLRYSIAEAQTDSVGFFKKLGYLWPRGVRYWQPPLEFDASGSYVHPEVPAILMIKPLADASTDTIERELLKRIISNVYRNRSLDSYRGVLPDAAMARAEGYVMGTLLGRVEHKMPSDDSLTLVDIELDEDAGRSKHYRTVALSQGVQHGFEPLQSMQLGRIHSFDEMLGAMKGLAFGARTLGQAADVLYAMATDPDCKVVMTLAGAVTVAKLDLIIAELIERGLVHCLVTTGAILCHGFNAERGQAHFKVPDDHSDTWFFEHGYNRIYDTIETEYVLDELQDILEAILSRQSPDRTLCSSDVVRQMGEYLIESGARSGLIQAAYRHNVPIFIPAFTDSEVGLDFAIFNYYRRQADRPTLHFDPFIDFERYREFIAGTKVRGILTLGGGVPRNWAQQIGPYLDAIARYDNAVATKSARFKYALRICPDPAFWGGLSGCTYSEGVSWGKFVPPDEGGQFAEVLSDFTFVFPLLVKGLFERLEKRA